MAAVEWDLTPTGTSRSARQRFSSRMWLSFDERPNAATSSQPHSLAAADPWSDEETKVLLEFPPLPQETRGAMVPAGS